MKIIKFLLPALAMVGFLVIKPGFDLYRAVCVGIAVVLTLIVGLMLHLKSGQAKEEITVDDPELAELLQGSMGENKGAILIQSVLLALLLVVIALLLSWLLSFTPVYGMFYDQDYQIFTHDLDVLIEAGDLESAVSRIDQRLEQPLSQAKQLKLAKRKYELYIELGRRETWTVAKEAYFALAEDTANTWGLDPSLANAERRAVMPTPTPQPTFTPWPTQTPWPTLTPVKTPTPMPTYTPYPSPTPAPTQEPDQERPPLDFSRCTESKVDNVLKVEGEFWAWDCGDWGWYGQWQPSSSTNPIGGKLPQPYVANSGHFYLCPPKADQTQPYTAKKCL